MCRVVQFSNFIHIPEPVQFHLWRSCAIYLLWQCLWLVLGMCSVKISTMTYGSRVSSARVEWPLYYLIIWATDHVCDLCRCWWPYVGTYALNCWNIIFSQKNPNTGTMHNNGCYISLSAACRRLRIRAWRHTHIRYRILPPQCNILPLPTVDLCGVKHLFTMVANIVRITSEYNARLYHLIFNYCISSPTLTGSSAVFPGHTTASRDGPPHLSLPPTGTTSLINKHP